MFSFPFEQQEVQKLNQNFFQKGTTVGTVSVIPDKIRAIGKEIRKSVFIVEFEN